MDPESSRAYVLPLILFSLLLMSIPMLSIMRERGWRNSVQLQVLKSEKDFSDALYACLKNTTLPFRYTCSPCRAKDTEFLRICGRTGRSNLYSGEVLRLSTQPLPLLDWNNLLVESQVFSESLEATALALPASRIAIHGKLKVESLQCTLKEHLLIASDDIEIQQLLSPTPCTLSLISLRGSIRVLAFPKHTRILGAAWQDLVPLSNFEKGTPLQVPVMLSSVESLKNP